MQVNTILALIDLGAMALPEFQRGFVWNRDQVRGLMQSLYKRHPVGSLLVWVTKTETADVKGNVDLTPGFVKLILDGQQRITSLYGIIKGKPPEFFDDKEKIRTFTGLYFNVEEEIFEFFAPLKMQDNPLWIDVTELMQSGVGHMMKKISQNTDFSDKYLNRLLALSSIKETIDFHIDEVTGEDMTVDVVVDIFNKVNSGGTKLSKGDLALAKICASWPDARNEMKKLLDKWKEKGFHFKLEWLLRNVNTILTGEALFFALKDVDTPTFQKGLKEAEKYINTTLNTISGRLGLDHDRVLGSRYSFPLLTRYLSQSKGHLIDHKERDKLLYWYIHTFLWGRYAGSTESYLNKDLELIKDTDGALDRLINELRQNRGDLKIQSNDFMGWSKSARFYPLLYMMTRVGKALDWESGLELKESILGKLNSLELHHIFPKSLLYKYGYSKSEVNALANFTFLTKETNLIVSNKNPDEYLTHYIEKYPGVIESHWIPTDRNLWKVENYLDFLTARRELLSNAANKFLDSLLTGEIPETEIVEPVLERETPVVIGSIESEEELQLLVECNDWIVSHGLPDGELEYELCDPISGDSLAILDLAWPNGLQERLSQPVALLIGEGGEIEEIVNRAGFRYFIDIEAFKEYVMKEILVLKDVYVD